MWTFLTKFINDHFAVATILILAALALIIFIVWWAASVWFKMKHLPCAKHEGLISGHDGNIAKVNSTLSGMAAQIDLLVKLSTSNRTAPLIVSANEYSAKHSPRRLNDNGLSLLRDICGEQFLADNGGMFVSEMEKVSPKTALDVENLALALLRVHSDDDIFIPLKNWVYEAPARELHKPTGVEMKEVTMDDVYFVLSLPLRDMYLEKHPEILPE